MPHILLGGIGQTPIAPKNMSTSRRCCRCKWSWLTITVRHYRLAVPLRASGQIADHPQRRLPELLGKAAHRHRPRGEAVVDRRVREGLPLLRRSVADAERQWRGHVRSIQSEWAGACFRTQTDIDSKEFRWHTLMVVSLGVT